MGQWVRNFIAVFFVALFCVNGVFAATCKSGVTKCAKLPDYDSVAGPFGTMIMGSYISGMVFSEPVAQDEENWTHVRNDVPIAGIVEGYNVSKMGPNYIHTVYCKTTSPFAVVFTLDKRSSVDTLNPAEICANADAVGFTNENGVITSVPVALDGDKCPSGFYTVPYNYSCGVGKVDVTDVPGCDEATDSSCLLITDTPCEMGFSMIRTSTGLTIPLWAEKYTTPAIHVAYNGGVCYAKLEPGNTAETLNVSYGGAIFHTVGATFSEEDIIDEATYAFFMTGGVPRKGLSNSVSIDIAAAGTFYIDWGDGSKQTINKNDTNRTLYSHVYSDTTILYDIKLGGHATAYNSDPQEPTISFSSSLIELTQISGSLGAIFSTLDDGTQPSFNGTFSYQSQLTGSIPENIFAGISGAPAAYMFSNTFYGCSGLTGSIPENMFAGISGAPAWYMFSGTFSGCRGLTGPSARINGMYLYEVWPNIGSSYVDGMYSNATGLSDYENIPSVWK